MAQTTWRKRLQEEVQELQAVQRGLEQVQNTADAAVKMSRAKELAARTQRLMDALEETLEDLRR